MRFIGPFIAGALFLSVPSANATVIADSMSEFATVQGADNWFYGFYDQGPGGPHSYNPVDFVEFDTVSGSSWTASDAQVGAQNNDFLNLNEEGGHPTGIGPGGQDSVIWAIRRYESEVDGLVDIGIDLRKLNVGNTGGGGITGRIFVDGVEVFTQLVENDDGDGFQVVLRDVMVSAGEFIDFAIDPTGSGPQTGNDGVFSARADGSRFRAQVCSPAGVDRCLPTVEASAPSTLWLLFAVVIGAQGCRRRRLRVSPRTDHAA